MRVLDRLDDTPAQVITGLSETLRQTRLAVALLGDQTRFTGFARSLIHRWFTDPAARAIYPDEDHPRHSRLFAADLRTAYSREGANSRAVELVDALLAASPEFAQLWRAHEIGLVRHGPQADPTPGGRRAGAALPGAVGLGPVAGAAGVHRRPRQRELPKAQLLSVIGDQRITS